MSDDLASDVLGYAHDIIKAEHRSSGAFGHPQECPGDGGSLSELATFTGRQLNWRGDEGTPAP